MLAKVLEIKDFNKKDMDNIIYLFKKANSNKNTIKQYEKHLRLFFGVNSVDDIQLNAVKNVKMNDIIDYMENNNSSYSNLNQFRSALNKFFKYTQEYCIQNNIDFPQFNPFDSTIVKNYVSSKEIKSVNNVKDTDLKTMDVNIPNLFIDVINSDISNGNKLRDSLIIKTLFYLGIRVEKLITLEVQDFIKTESGYSVFIKKAKGNKNRIININKKFYDEIMNYIYIHSLNSEDKIFRARGNEPFSTTKSINDMIHKYEKRLKQKGMIEENLNITAHRFRELAGTKRIESGYSINELSDFLGHSNFNTSRTYMNTILQLQNTKNSELYTELF